MSCASLKMRRLKSFERPTKRSRRNGIRIGIRAQTRMPSCKRSTLRMLRCPIRRSAPTMIGPYEPPAPGGQDPTAIRDQRMTAHRVPRAHRQESGLGGRSRLTGMPLSARSESRSGDTESSVATACSLRPRRSDCYLARSFSYCTSGRTDSRIRLGMEIGAANTRGRAAPCRGRYD